MLNSIRRLCHLPTASIRTYVLAVMLIAALPISLLMSGQVWVQSNINRQRLLDEVVQSAASISQSVDREIQSSVDVLKILSYQDDIQHGDYQAFGQLLRRQPLLKKGWNSIYLKSAAGEMLLDSAHPGGAPPSAAQGAPEMHQWAVSNLLREDDGTFATAIEVPVIIDGEPRLYLGARLSFTVWQRIIMDSAPAEPGRTALIDRNFRMMARNRMPEKFIGTEVAKGNQALMRSRPSGLEKLVTVENDTSLVGWATVPASGWIVAVGMPTRPLDVIHAKTLLMAIATVGSCLGLGFLISFLVAQKLIKPLRRLAGHDISMSSETIAVREIAILRDSLAEARRQEEENRELIRRKGELLEKKAAEFEAVLLGSPIGLAFAHDRECRYVTHNEAMSKLFGGAERQDEAAVLYQGVLLRPDQRPLQRAAASGETITGMELEVRAPGREPIFVIASAIPLLDERRQPQGAVGAVMDITARKLSEKHLLIAERKLRESQRLVDLAQETGHVGFFQYVVDERSVVWTPGQSMLFGFSETQDLGSLAAWTRRIDGEDWRRTLRTVRRSVAAGEEIGKVDYCVHLPDGSSRWLSSRLRIIYDQGKPQHIVGVTVDMTEQKIAERERDALVARAEEARREAEAANRSKDEFLAMLGHELRNPLSAIGCSTEVLNQVDGNTEIARTARGIIARQTRHLSHMMDDLLDVSRVMAGRVEMPRYPLALDALADRVVNTLALSGELREHRVVPDLHEAWIEGNATRMEQIVNNLVINAVKYTPAGGRIDVRVAREDGEAVLEVADDGPGIPPELLPRIFDLFIQGKRSLDRRGGGLGIGLTLVRRLVEMHHGRIVAGNRSPGTGTLMRVTLPAIEPQVLREQPPAGDAGHRRPRRIVVVDDNEDIVASLTELLRAEGHTVFGAHDGRGGLDMILQLAPDVAVVDIGLPEFTGYEIARICRGSGFRGKLVAFSGYGNESDRQKALSAGFDEHLLKPVPVGKLMRIILDD